MARTTLTTRQRTGRLAAHTPPKRPAVPAVRPPGRPSKFTATVRLKLLEGVALGLFTEVAVAEYAGVTYRTLRYWLSRAERVIEAHTPEIDGEDTIDVSALPEDDRLFFQFFHDYQQAKSKAEAVSLGTIRKATEKNWQAHAWYLERRRPDVYAVRHRHEFSGPGGGPIVTSLITADDRTKRLERLRARLGSRAG